MRLQKDESTTKETKPFWIKIENEKKFTKT